MEYGIVLYASEDRKRGHAITADYCDGQLTVSRYDWGRYEYNRHGNTDDCHYYDRDNTEKFFISLKARSPKSFLKKLKRKFSDKDGNPMADINIESYCDKLGIRYRSEYFY